MLTNNVKNPRCKQLRFPSPRSPLRRRGDGFPWKLSRQKLFSIVIIIIFFFNE